MKTIIRPLETMRTELPEIFLDNSLATYSLNLRYYYGELKKRPGIASPKWQIGELIQGVYNYKKHSGDNLWVVLTPNDAYKLNEDGSCVFITPVYNTGTISISEPNLNIVTGTGTQFITGGVKAGHKLALSANQNSPSATWYQIASVDSETQLTLTSNATVYSGNYTIRKRFLADPDLYRWRAITINDKFIFTNGYNAVLVYDGTGFATELIDTPFFYLTGFLNRLIVGKVLTADDERPNYIQWSTTADIGDFTGIGSGAKYFWETGQHITGLGRAQSVLAIYQEDYVFMGIPTGQAEDAFNWQLKEIGQGLIAPHSLVEAWGINFGLGRNDFFVFDGNSYIPIGSEIIKLFKEITPLNSQQKTIAFADSFNCVHFIADTLQGRLDFKYDLRFKRWSIDEFKLNITAGGVVE